MTIYYPYLRAKQKEVIAVEKAAAKLAANGNILPVFEPVKLDLTILSGRASKFATAGLPVAIVINPQVGDLVGSSAVVNQLLPGMRSAQGVVYAALLVQGTTQPTDIATLVAAAGGNLALFVHRGVPTSEDTINDMRAVENAIHIFIEGATGTVYEEGYPQGSRVRLRNAFQAQRRNVDYPPSSFFSDLHLNYQQLKLSGFGDYATVGSEYQPGGGAAYAVAIHMTEAIPSGIKCNHFLSTSNLTQADQAGKFGQAVNALFSYSQQNPGQIDFSDACQEFLQARAQGRYPGLPEVKRLSIQHHLELMCGLV